jgi:predicted DNA-binding transcriptional regulator
MRLDDYAHAFQRAKGNPQTRVRTLARQLGVKERTVLTALLQTWGRERCLEVFPLRPKGHGHRAHEYVSAYDHLRGPHEARVRQIAKRFKVQEQSVVVSLRRAWGIVEWQRRLGKRRRTKVEEYAAGFQGMSGDPQRRILGLARKHKVSPEAMRKALWRYWGADRFTKLVRRSG